MFHRQNPSLSSTIAHSHPAQNAAGWTLLALALPLLWWVTHPGQGVMFEPATFLFLHTAVEMLAVVVALLVFVTGYRAILSSRKGAVVLLGVAFLGVALLDFLHAMAYVGMPDVVTANTPHKPMLFWLAARLLGATALLLYALLPAVSDVTLFKKRLALALMVAVVGVLGYVGMAQPKRIPALFIDSQGLTPWQLGLEWLVIGLHAATLGVLWLRRQALAQECLHALAFCVALSGVSGLFFTLSGAVDKNSADVLGYVFKVAAYLYLFHATFNEALIRPLGRLNVQHLREKVTLDAAPDGVLWVDHDGRILMANPAMKTLTGYDQAALLGQNVAILLPEHLRAAHAHSMRDSFAHPNPRAMGLVNLKLQRCDGQLVPVDISLGYWDDEGASHAIVYIRDLTERKKFEESLRYQATHDELTGLPNRWFFRLQLSQAVARAVRHSQRVAVLLLDLDHFKTVNDSFGHATGDALLIQAGARMRGVLREKDTLARLGGDEFAVLITDLDTMDEVINVANKLLASLQGAFHLERHEVQSGGSLGIAFYPDDAQDSDTLLRFAGTATHHAKQAGRGAYAFYSQDMDKHAHEEMQLHTRLKEAIALGTLQLHYQPQVDVHSGAVVGAEALLRWVDPVLGHVPPTRFIPMAEATGLILPLSDWVLETACTQIAAWMAQGIPVRVAINVSAQQFRQRDLPEKVRAALARSGATAQWLDIEITESVAMTQPEQAREQLDALVALGCRVALDDFGTGYSSLAYLKALPVSKLKIDKSFMDGIPQNNCDVAITVAIIALAHSLGMTLVAEGVETDAQRDFLRQRGCEAYQGWLFAKAMTAQDLTAMLQQAAPTPWPLLSYEI